MADKTDSAAKKRRRELPRVRLIPTIDPKSDAVMRKKEVQLILSMMFANLHKRGRPVKGGDPEKDYAA